MNISEEIGVIVVYLWWSSLGALGVFGQSVALVKQAGSVR